MERCTRESRRERSRGIPRPTRAGRTRHRPAVALVLFVVVAGAMAGAPVRAAASEAKDAAPEAAKSAAPEAAKDAAAEAAKGPAPEAAKVATPWPRRHVLPDPGFEPIEGAEPPPAWDPAKWRFTVVATIASWNPASAGAVEWLDSLATELAPRKVLVLGAFSHDTAPSASRFIKVTRPRFPVGLASGAFLKGMGNPKVPTVWVVDARGEIVARKELPDASERDSLRGRLRLWTDF